MSDKALTRWGMFALMVVGAVVHAWVLDFGRFEPKRMDWPKENGAYRIMAEAVKEWRMPYHGSVRLQATQRFLAVPEFIWFPTVLALRYMDFVPFALLHVLVVYTIGQVGLALLARRLALGWVGAALLVLIFNLNGHIIAHLANGHTMWAGYFLLSWVMLGVVALLEGRDRAAAALGIALALWVMLLQGAFHLWVITLIFVGVLCASRRSLWGAGLVVYTVTMALAMARLLPAAVTFHTRNNPFLTGFPTLLHLLEGLVVPHSLASPVLREPHLSIAIGWWELSHFVGLLPLAFIVWHGILARWDNAHRYLPELDLPIAVVTVLSIGVVYWPVTLLPLPIFNSQRVTSRFFILPLLFLTMLAAVDHSRGGTGRWRVTGWMAALGLMLALGDIGRHAAGWRVPRADRLLPVKPYYEEYNAARIIDWDEPRYELAVQAGLVLSALSLMAVLALLAVPRWRGWWVTRLPWLRLAAPPLPESSPAPAPRGRPRTGKS